MLSVITIIVATNQSQQNLSVDSFRRDRLWWISCVRISFDFEELVVENHFISVVSQSETLAKCRPLFSVFSPSPLSFGRKIWSFG